MTTYDGTPIRDLTSAAQVDELSDATWIDLASAAYGLGNNFRVDWEEFYKMLESQYGWFLPEFDNPADRKIRRKVRKWIGEGLVQ